MSQAVRAAIVGVGAYVPEKVLANADLERMIDTSSEWIIRRTGIAERRVAAAGESTATMSVLAGRRACEAAGVDPATLDLIIVATISPETLCPATACYVQRDLGATGAAAFDLNAACSGFLYSLAVARTFVESGAYKNVLVVGAETLTRVTDYSDRGSCILFGDGAGAVVLQPTTEPGRGVLHTFLAADGAGADFIYIPAGGSAIPASADTVAKGMHTLRLRGREVYKFAVEKMQLLLEQCMAAAGVTADQVDLVVPHQVNIRIIESATERAGFPADKVFVNIDRLGNTSAASIPMALDEAVRTGRCGKGSLVLLIAFGAGLTWAGAVVRL